MTVSFRQRCASALTHPLTIAAVVVLLANDLAFKMLWPDHWVTGKLSDLAWVAFSPPLLALLLSSLTFRKPLAERAAFAAAYTVLPLTYVAFNSSEAVHRWVLSVLLPLTGSIRGSPLDPTDSLVVLPGLALAVWVWRQAPARPESTRMRLYLFATVAMALATVATSPNPGPSETAWFVGVSDRGAVLMEGPRYGEYYESRDGGVTWNRTEIPWEQRANIEWGGAEAETPRGTYAIQGFNVVRSRPGAESTVVYSADYLKEGADRWAHQYVFRHLRDEVGDQYPDPSPLFAEKLFNLVYDGRSGNVILAMGWNGILTGDAAGRWTRVGVGEFTPTALSFPAKARLMLSHFFWFSTLAVSLSFMTAVFILLASTGHRQSIVSSRQLKYRWPIVFLLLCMVVIGPGISIRLPISGVFMYLSLAFIASPALCLAMFALTWPREGVVRVIIAALFAIVGAIVSLISFPPYGGAGDSLGLNVERVSIFFALIFSALAAAIYFPRMSELRAYTAGLLAMMAFAPLSFLLWLADRLSLVVASLGTVVLLLLVAGALFGYLVRRRRAVE